MDLGHDVIADSPGPVVYLKWIGLVFGAIGLACALVAHGKELWESCLAGCAELGVFAVVPIAIACMISTVLSIPVDFWLVGSGAIFQTMYGITKGSGVAIVACCSGVYFGCLVAFYLGRTILKPKVETYLEKFKMLQVINAVIETDGWKFAFVMRLSPLIPQEPLNYACSFTSMTFKHNALATFGTMPKTAYEVWLGAQAANGLNSSEGQHGHDYATYILNIIVLAFMVLLCILAKKRYDDHINQSAVLDDDVKILMRRATTLRSYNNLSRNSGIIHSTSAPLLWEPTRSPIIHPFRSRVETL